MAALDSTIEILGLLAAGGGVGALSQVVITSLTTKKELKKDNQDFIKEGFELAVKVVTDQRDDALTQLREVRRELADLHLEVMGLKLSNSFDPFPRWMVNLDGKYIYVNSCFVERFLEPLGHRERDIIGQGHDFLWPPELCKKIASLDAAARVRPDGRARAVTLVNGVEWTIYKFPVRVQGVIVAYAGYMMEMV